MKGQTIPTPVMIIQDAGRINYSAETIEELAQLIEDAGGTVIVRLNGKLYRIEEMK